MADYKHPADATMLGRAALNANDVIDFPEARMDEGSTRSFEFVVVGAQGIDTNVSFKIFSALEIDALDYDNIEEAVEGVDLTGLTGDLVFKRVIVNTLDTAYRVILTGTNTGSTATFLIRARAE